MSNDKTMTQKQFDEYLTAVIAHMKTKTRCIVCDQELDKDEGVLRWDVMHQVFGKEVPYRLHEFCDRDLGTSELQYYAEFGPKSRRYF